MELMLPLFLPPLGSICGVFRPLADAGEGASMGLWLVETLRGGFTKAGDGKGCKALLGVFASMTGDEVCDSVTRGASPGFWKGVWTDSGSSNVSIISAVVDSCCPEAFA